MTISDEDMIECWFGRLNEPEIVKELGLLSTRELRLHWRRLKELGKLPLTSRVTGERDLLLERLLKVHGEPRARGATIADQRTGFNEQIFGANGQIPGRGQSD